MAGIDPLKHPAAAVAALPPLLPPPGSNSTHTEPGLHLGQAGLNPPEGYHP